MKKVGIKSWIKKEMRDKVAVIVVIGRYIANRPWVIYEIEKVVGG